jgi:chromosome segregation ATPase
MTVMIAEVYDALRSAGAEDDRARRAAEAVAEWKGESQGLRTEVSDLRTVLSNAINDSRTELRAEISDLRTELRAEISDLRTELRSEVHKIQLELERVRGELSVLKWMFGALIVLNTGILVRLLFS